MGQMYAMMALYDSDLKDEMFTLLQLADIQNYSQFTELNGSSPHGKKEGSVAWPGTNEIFLLIVTEEQRSKLKQCVAEYKEQRTPAPGLLVFDWKLEGII